MITGNSKIESFVHPATSQLTPMVHLLFKIYLANICPMVGTRSNFAVQDVIVVAILLSSKKFDLAELMLKNMYDILSAKNSTGFSYGLQLTKVFKWYGEELLDKDCVPTTEVFDTRYLTQSN